MKEKSKRERSKNLNDDSIEKIVGILDGWAGSLTWNTLITEIELHLKEKYTRQTLAKHTRIKSAYNLTKERISNDTDTKSKGSVEIQALQQIITNLEAKNARLHRENQDLLAQFARWSYNTYLKGISKEELDKVLPNINR